MRRLARSHPIASYAVLACVLSWSLWIPMLVRGDIARAGVGWPSHLPGLVGPAIAGILVTGAVDGRAGLAQLWSRIVRWRIGWRWWALVLATAALATLGVVVALVSGDEPPPVSDFALYSGIANVGLVPVVLIALVVNGFGEEIGWRGFAVERLSREHGLVSTALAVTGIWALWHLPLFWIIANFRDFGVAGAVGWLVGLTAGSLVLTWLYLTSGRSIALVAAWHTAFNLTSATAATAGTAAAVSSTLVMVGAVAIVVTQGRRRSSRQVA